MCFTLFALFLDKPFSSIYVNKLSDLSMLRTNIPSILFSPIESTTHTKTSYLFFPPSVR